MIRLSRTPPLAASVVLLAAAAALVLAPTPARASTAKTVTIGPNTTQTITYAGFTQENEEALVKTDLNNEGVAMGAETPAECAVDPMGCLTIPITLSLTQHQLLHDTLSFGATVTYKDGVDAYVPVVGEDEEGQELRVYLWSDKPAKDKNGNATYLDYDGENDPGYLSTTIFPSTHFFLVVQPIRTLDKPFTIKYSLQDVNAFTGVGTGITDTGSASPGTSSPGAPSVSSTPGATTPVAGTGAILAPVGGAVMTNVPVSGSTPPELAVPDIANGVPDPSLVAAADINVPYRLGISGSTKVTGGASQAQTAVKDSSAGLVLLELLILPALAVIGTLWVVARRRRRDRRVGGFDGTVPA